MEQITKTHILEAIKEIDRDGIRKGRSSSTYELIHNGNSYPPKLVISIANRFATGEELDPKTFKGGEDTPAFNLLEDQGIKVKLKSEPILQLITNYKKHISQSKLEDEKYKWELIKEYKGQPNVNSENFTTEIESLKLKNLTYQMAVPVIKHLAKVDSEHLRGLFSNLFDESIDLNARILSFKTKTSEFYKELEPTLTSHQDERTMATYLTLHNPEKYTFYTNTLYKGYCDLVGLKSAKTNECYSHYLQLINTFVKDYIEKDLELIELVKEFIPDYYDGENHLLLAQDILYNVFSKSTTKNGLNDEETHIVKIFKRVGLENMTDFHELVKEIVDNITLKQGNNKAVFTLTKDNRIGLIIGQRYSLVLEADKKQTTYHYIDKVNGTDSDWFNSSTNWADVINSKSNIITSTQKEFELVKTKSGFRRSHSESLEKTFFDDEYKQYLFEKAFGNEDDMIWVKGKIEFGKDNFYKYNYWNKDFQKTFNLPKEVTKIKLKYKGELYENITVVRSGHINFLQPEKRRFLSHDYIEALAQNELIEIEIGYPKNFMNNTQDSPEFFNNYLAYLLNIVNQTSKSANFNKNTAKHLITKKWTQIYSSNFPSKKLTDEELENLDSLLNENYQKRFTGKTLMGNYIKYLKGLQNVMTPTNEILYGPPGTGKTYKLKSEYFPKYTSKETSITKEKHLENVVSSCSWWQVIGVALLELGKAKVSDIFDHSWVREKARLSNSKTVRPTLWGQLQSHTIEGCEYVNVKKRMDPLIFNKTEDSYWEILKENVEEQVPELVDLLKSVNEFIPNPDKEIKRYKFVTFHQSYGYEEFIEGIKPVMDNDSGDSSEIGYKIVPGIFKELCTQAERDPENKYAIFIDEINRGNVSAIFGELITLIELDKRKDGANPMSVDLPYSNTNFTVPSNIDIYGTMNTADRSVEALDTALRRRFTFKEMLPDITVLKNVKVGKLSMADILSTINERIEMLIDRDHTIGHSYFIGVNNKEKLLGAFKDKIIPLLQEYFYGDYGKIGLVLGNGFAEKIKGTDVSFAEFKGYEDASSLKQDSFVLKPLELDTIIEAIQAI